MTEGLDHVVDGRALAGSQVAGKDAGLFLAQMVECDEVTPGEVFDMDVVADGGAVFRGVICTMSVAQ